VSVISVLNYKGGVGKTTVAANLGAELAYRGQRVLLLDMDPQASLTLSFYGSDELDRDFADSGTILHWFQSFIDTQRPADLADFVVSPPRVNDLVRPRGGRLDLIASHLGLIDVDLDLAAYVGGSRFQVSSPGYLWVHRLLADALDEPAFAEYDVVLIDCAPNFNIVTQSAIVASDNILVPSRPDYLSTLAITSLFHNVDRLVETYNHQTLEYNPGHPAITPTALGVVFTMVQYKSVNPVNNHLHYMDLTQRRNPGLPIFKASIRENVAFGAENPDGVPVILRLRAADKIYIELMALAAEFLGTSAQPERAVA